MPKSKRTEKMDLMTLIEQFDSDAKCRTALELLRWPKGPQCLRCRGEKVFLLPDDRGVIECYSCGYQFTVTVGTIFHDTHLPLRKWFVATFLMCESKKGISALQMKRTIKVAYKTAWYLCHRIRAAMAKVNPEPLRGIVEVDETYVGGKVRGQGRGYRGIGDKDTRHETVNHRAEEWVRGDVHTNSIESVWSLFDRSVIGAFHHVSVKHLDAYLDELEWRYNNRENSFLFRDTLVRLLSTANLEYKNLVQPL